MQPALGAPTAAGTGLVACRVAPIHAPQHVLGLPPEVHIDLVPVLLGKGVRLFEHLGPEPVELEQVRLVEAPDITHLMYRVVK